MCPPPDWFDEIVAGYRELAASLGIEHVAAIPLSALKGDNMLEHSKATPWYRDETLLEHLENVQVDASGKVEGLRSVSTNEVCWKGSTDCGSAASRPSRLKARSATRSNT